MKTALKLLSGIIIFLSSISFITRNNEGTAIIKYRGYKNCIELRNSNVRVILGPQMGGRILSYELNGNNVLYEDPELDGVIYTPGERTPGTDAGRFDIGPEHLVPRRPALSVGKWEGKISGIREADLISQKDTSTGVQIIRNFRLDENSSRLYVTQTIRNVSETVKYYSHWSRTFAEGGGISLTPLNSRSRFPKGYLNIKAESGTGVMDYRPADEPNVRVRNGILEIIGAPGHPEFAMDVSDGWTAYITKDNQLFVKKFPVYPDRIYGEMSASNVVIWYNTQERMCEIEPIGPWETIRPGEQVSFTETWYLFDFKYPEDKIPDQEKIISILNNL